jgi:hypothetical protein
MKSQKLSEKGIKRFNLENAEQSIEKSKKAVPVKEWTSYDDYFKDEFEDRHNNKKWYEKVKDFFVYSIGWNVRDWWIDTKWYFYNLKCFQPMIKSWRPWDYQYQIDLFVFGLKQLADTIDRYGNEEDVSRNKKIAAIRSLIAEIELDYEDVVDKRFSSIHGYFGKIIKYSDGSVSHICTDEDAYVKDRERYHAALKKARKAHYDKIFKLIIGQDDDKLNQMVKDKYEVLSEEEKKKFDPYVARVELFDGSGIEGWWD